MTNTTIKGRARAPLSGCGAIDEAPRLGSDERGASRLLRNVQELTPKFARRSSAAERPTMRFSTRSSYRSGVIEMWLRDPRGMAIVAAPPLKLEVVGEL